MLRSVYKKFGISYKKVRLVKTQTLLSEQRYPTTKSEIVE